MRSVMKTISFIILLVRNINELFMIFLSMILFVKIDDLVMKTLPLYPSYFIFPFLCIFFLWKRGNVLMTILIIILVENNFSSERHYLYYESWYREKILNVKTIFV